MPSSNNATQREVQPHDGHGELHQAQQQHEPVSSAQQRITQSTLASTKQHMQQVKTADSVNPSGKVTKRVNLNQNEAESATSSTDHASSGQPARGVNNFMPTQAPQNSAFYFQQA